MNMQTMRDVVSRDAQIAVVISQENNASNASPLRRVVEFLVETSLMAKCDVTDLSSKGQITETLVKCLEVFELRV